MSRFGIRTRSGRALGIFALVTLLSAPWAWRASQAEEIIDLTLLYHGAVQGKIAPCG